MVALAKKLGAQAIGEEGEVYEALAGEHDAIRIYRRMWLKSLLKFASYLDLWRLAAFRNSCVSRCVNGCTVGRPNGSVENASLRIKGDRVRFHPPHRAGGVQCLKEHRPLRQNLRQRSLQTLLYLPCRGIVLYYQGLWPVRPSSSCCFQGYRRRISPQKGCFGDLDGASAV